MKRICFLITLTIIAALSVSCKSEPTVSDGQEGPYTITTIAENVYHIQDCNDENPSGESFDENGKPTHFNNCSDIYLIVGTEKALVIDLSNKIEWADNAEESLRKVVYDRIGDRELQITFTHNHGDHTGMFPAFQNEERAFFAIPAIDLGKDADQVPENRRCLYDEGETFDLGGYKVHTILVPGHTAGSMVFHLEGTDILFTGDAIGSGHGVWIFNTEAFENYVAGFPHLVEYIENGTNGINKDNLKIYGGHFWQKDWFPELGDGVFGLQYISDMQALIRQIANGTAATEPSGLSHPVLDTYFRNGQAIVAWNAKQAEDYRAALAEAEQE